MAKKVNSEIDNLSNKMPSVQAETLQLLPFIKFSSFLFSEFIIFTQQYFLEMPLKIYNSINKHINYYCPKNVSFFFPLFLLPQSLNENVLEMFLSWNNSNTYLETNQQIPLSFQQTEGEQLLSRNFQGKYLNIALKQIGNNSLW